MGRPMRSLEEHFWGKVNKQGPVPAERPELGPCWLWTAGRGSHGYGVHYLPGKVQVLAHRFSLTITGGEPPHQGLHALHDCDDKRCVNPTHLHWGSHQDNMREAAERGLSKPGMTLGSHCPKGHGYEPQNILHSTRKGPHGKRYAVHSCRECNRIYLANRRAKQRQKELS